MKRILFMLAAAFMAVAASAQNEKPTVNWPYIFPDFEEGTIEKTGGIIEKSRYNIHLNIGALHFLENGKIKEHPTVGIKSMTIGETVFRNVGGKMLKVLGQTDGGFVVEETLANYGAIISRDGAYGGAVADRDKTFSQHENNGSLNGYLLTDSYADLIAIKHDSADLPVVRKVYIVMGIQKVFINKKSVLEAFPLDKKAFSAFLKAENIKWTDTDDLLKVIDYIAENK